MSKFRNVYARENKRKEREPREKIMECEKCGTLLSRMHNFCPTCGTKVSGEEGSVKKKKKKEKKVKKGTSWNRTRRKT